MLHERDPQEPDTIADCDEGAMLRAAAEEHARARLLVSSEEAYAPIIDLEATW